MKIFSIFFIIFFCSISSAEEYRIIYIIHGDGNYLYHNDKGNAVDAAGRILKQARFVAENIKRGEVFIFLQKESGKFLFFSKDDGDFFYYRNGIEIVEDSYSRNDKNIYERETELIQKYSEDLNKPKKNILIYYGHEIPPDDTPGYHSSKPEIKFGINLFADGISKLINSFAAIEGKFDLIILSTCRNGTEEVVSALSSYTNYFIASPTDIHLSYFNSESLIGLTGKNIMDTESLALGFAGYAFEELCSAAITEVSINVYSFENDPGEKNYLKNFYRPPEFGLRKNQGN